MKTETLRYTRCRWACATVFPCKNAPKLFIHLRSSIKHETAWFQQSGTETKSKYEAKLC